MERFATRNRESGSEDEREAARAIAARLGEAAELYLSLPRGARVQVEGGAAPLALNARTPAFSISTGDSGRGGRLVYLPAAFAQGVRRSLRLQPRNQP